MIGKMKKIVLFLLLLILAGLAGVGGFYYWLTHHYANSSGSLAQEQVVIIAPGTSGIQITQLLQEKGIIEGAVAFRLLSLLEGKAPRFQAGEYAFSPGITPLGVMDKLAKGEVVRYQITIPEGKTSAEIIEILSGNSVLQGTIPSLPAEGSLLPETYDFTRGTLRSDLISRMTQAQRELLDKIWPQRDPNLPFVTPAEAITLASIVEKETGLPDERRRIAAVYINRLKIGMPLQADPTVAYGRYGGQYADKALTVEDLKTDTPYNTYIHKNLPPGPICHPGKEAIKATLHPLATKEIYFVATGDGGHRFAETLEQHTANVREYRKWQASERKKQ